MQIHYYKKIMSICCRFFNCCMTAIVNYFFICVFLYICHLVYLWLSLFSVLTIFSNNLWNDLHIYCQYIVCSFHGAFFIYLDLSKLVIDVYINYGYNQITIRQEFPLNVLLSILNVIRSKYLSSSECFLQAMKYISTSCVMRVIIPLLLNYFSIPDS